MGGGGGDFAEDCLDGILTYACPEQEEGGRETVEVVQRGRGRERRWDRAMEEGTKSTLSDPVI